MRATAASPPWQWISIAASERRADHDLLAAADQTGRQRSVLAGNRPDEAAAGHEVPGDEFRAPGPSIRRVAIAPRPGGVSWISGGEDADMRRA